MKKMMTICGSSRTQFINYNLIKREELYIILEEITSCIDQYGLSNSKFSIKSFEISKRLKTSAGVCDWDLSKDNIFKIKLAYNNYREFGFNSIIRTLRHEMAHLIEVVLYGGSGHTERFKKICSALDGSMNPKMAGRKYSKNSSSEYCRTMYKYKYICSCGSVVKRKQRIVDKRTLRSACIVCGTMVMDMKLEAI